MARVSALIGAETGQVYSSEEMLAAVTQQFNKFTMCINCSTEYKTNSFTCQKWGESVEGCLYGTGSCSVCKDGLILDGLTCEPCDPSCRTCHTHDMFCSSCYPPATLNDINQCAVCEPPCLSCSPTNSSFCSTCVKGYSLYPDSNSVCYKCDDHLCEVCDDTDTSICRQCKKGSFSSNSSCQECP